MITDIRPPASSIDFSLKGGSRYINLGDWIRYYTYAVFDGQHLSLCTRYPELESKIIRQ
jgi:UDP-2,3-diacylglucosamine hydrolase